MSCDVSHELEAFGMPSPGRGEVSRGGIRCRAVDTRGWKRLGSTGHASGQAVHWLACDPARDSGRALRVQPPSPPRRNTSFNKEEGNSMGSRVKKDRRASNVRFVKAQKTPTPLEERHEFRETVRKPFGLRDGGQRVPRSASKLKAVREKWGLGESKAA